MKGENLDHTEVYWLGPNQIKLYLYSIDFTKKNAIQSA